MNVIVGKTKVISTRDHHYEFIGNSADEAYDKLLYTLNGWNIPGKTKQLWMLGTMDLYIDVTRQNQVLTFPVNYYGYR
jgi:hypothetical protein